MKTLARKRYLETLSVLKDKNLIKVATGVRRCGKSTLMMQFQDLLCKDNDKTPILSINLDLPDYRFLAEKIGRKSMIISLSISNKTQRIMCLLMKCKMSLNLKNC